ncbi:MAG: 3-dehydroquinate synthase family protein [Acidimicrobiia bacterium]
MERLVVVGVTEVIIGEGMPEPLLPPRLGRVRAALLTQPGATDHAFELVEVLRDGQIACEVIGLPDRDEAKTLAVAESVYEAFARFGLARDDTVIGVGGGAVTDLAGFVAGTWLRGIEVVHYPTTLLAAVDAAVGGKAGVNLGGKNLVGVLWHPSRVIIDLRLLRSLPPYLRREGMAEALKAGLVGDEKLFSLMVQEGQRAPLEEVVTRAVGVKARIVGEDERETGVRAYLNFGHTIGHAIEFASALSHGESVGLGMIAAARLSERLLGFEEAARVEAAVAALGLPTRVEGLERARVRDLLGYDKKRDARGLRMVLLRRVGEPVLRHVTVPEADVAMEAIGL